MRSAERIRADIVIIIPVGRKEELYVASETLRDLEVFYTKHSYYVVFVDDTPGFDLRGFNGENYTTIWSGCQGIRRDLGAGLKNEKRTVFFTICAGLRYAYYRVDFDILQYMETDCCIVEKGLDIWIYSMQQKYGFDLLGVLDDEAAQYEQFINVNAYCRRIPCFKDDNNFVFNTDLASYKYPVAFLAIHFLSHRIVRKLVENDAEYAILRSFELMRSCNSVATEPHYTTLIRLLGGKIVFWGGMDQGASSGSARAPVLALDPTPTPTPKRTHLLNDAIQEYKIIHSLKNFNDFDFAAGRDFLSQRREEQQTTRSPLSRFTMDKDDGKSYNADTKDHLSDFKRFLEKGDKARSMHSILTARLRSMQGLLIEFRWREFQHRAWKKVVLFGAGKHTRHFVHLMTGEVGPDVVFIVDDKVETAGSSIEGIPVRHFTALSENDFDGVDAIVLSTDTFQEQMRNSCERLSIKLPIVNIYDAKTAL
jgi:hypothetical protein